MRFFFPALLEAEGNVGALVVCIPPRLAKEDNPMCFRPAEIGMNKCPQCGASNKPIATTCEACGAELPKVVIDRKAQQERFIAEARADIAGSVSQPPKAPELPIDE